ncbi:MAG: hypothetical protein ACXVW0_08625 [Nocardioides sp.]
MTSTPRSASRPKPVERFAPTSGLFLGWAGLAFAAVAVVWVAFEVHTVTGLRVGLGAAVFALVVWMTQLRPRAAAYPRDLVLRNSVRDTHIPLHAVEEVTVRQSLQVYADGRRHVCIGIGRSAREQLKATRRRRQQTMGFSSRWQEFKGKAEMAGLDERAMTYATFVETRIDELAEQARKEQVRDSRPSDVRRTWAWPEVGALAVTTVAFVVACLL